MVALALSCVVFIVFLFIYQTHPNDTDKEDLAVVDLQLRRIRPLFPRPALGSYHHHHNYSQNS
jgi:hypothetical protein